MNGEQHKKDSASCLFLVRLWPETLGGSCLEVRAEVRHVQSGEVRYFRDLGSLTSFLAEKMSESIGQAGMAQSGVLQPIDG